MAYLEVPTNNQLPAYKYTVTLDGTSYQLDFQWNDRMSKWFVSVSDPQGNILEAPVPIVATWPLFDRFKNQSIFPGTLFCLDTSGQNEDPGRFDLGDRCRMVYLEFGT
jgi:hypothetical protein